MEETLQSMEESAKAMESKDVEDALKLQGKTKTQIREELELRGPALMTAIRDKENTIAGAEQELVAVIQACLERINELGQDLIKKLDATCKTERNNLEEGRERVKTYMNKLDTAKRFREIEHAFNRVKRKMDSKLHVNFCEHFKNLVEKCELIGVAAFVAPDYIDPGVWCCHRDSVEIGMVLSSSSEEDVKSEPSVPDVTSIVAVQDADKEGAVSKSESRQEAQKASLEESSKPSEGPAVLDTAAPAAAAEDARTESPVKSETADKDKDAEALLKTTESQLLSSTVAPSAPPTQPTDEEKTAETVAVIPDIPQITKAEPLDATTQTEISQETVDVQTEETASAKETTCVATQTAEVSLETSGMQTEEASQETLKLQVQEVRQETVGSQTEITEPENTAPVGKASFTTQPTDIFGNLNLKPERKIKQAVKATQTDPFKDGVVDIDTSKHKTFLLENRKAVSENRPPVFPPCGPHKVSVCAHVEMDSNTQIKARERQRLLNRGQNSFPVLSVTAEAVMDGKGAVQARTCDLHHGRHFPDLGANCQHVPVSKASYSHEDKSLPHFVKGGKQSSHVGSTRQQQKHGNISSHSPRNILTVTANADWHSCCRHIAAYQPTTEHMGRTVHAGLGTTTGQGQGQGHVRRPVASAPAGGHSETTPSMFFGSDESEDEGTSRINRDYAREFGTCSLGTQSSVATDPEYQELFADPEIAQAARECKYHGGQRQKKSVQDEKSRKPPPRDQLSTSKEGGFESKQKFGERDTKYRGNYATEKRDPSRNIKENSQRRNRGAYVTYSSEGNKATTQPRQGMDAMAGTPRHQEMHRAKMAVPSKETHAVSGYSSFPYSRPIKKDYSSQTRDENMPRATRLVFQERKDWETRISGDRGVLQDEIISVPYKQSVETRRKPPNKDTFNMKRKDTYAMRRGQCIYPDMSGVCPIHGTQFEQKIAAERARPLNVTRNSSDSLQKSLEYSNTAVVVHNVSTLVNPDSSEHPQKGHEDCKSELCTFTQEKQQHLNPDLRAESDENTGNEFNQHCSCLAKETKRVSNLQLTALASEKNLQDSNRDNSSIIAGPAKDIDSVILSECKPLEGSSTQMYALRNIMKELVFRSYQKTANTIKELLHDDDCLESFTPMVDIIDSKEETVFPEQPKEDRPKLRATPISDVTADIMSRSHVLHVSHTKRDYQLKLKTREVMNKLIQDRKRQTKE